MYADVDTEFRFPYAVDQRVGPYVPTGSLLETFGVKRHISGYNGALYQLTKLNDNATLEVSCQALRDTPDYGAIAAWKAGTTAVFSKVYGQNGSGLVLTPTNLAMSPPYDDTIMFNGVVPACLTGELAFSSFSAFSYDLGVTGISIDRRNSTTFLVHCPRSSLQKNIYFEYRNAGSFSFGGFTDSAISNGYYTDDGTTKRSASMPRAQLSVVGLVAGGANSITHLKETTFSSSILAAGTADSFYVGTSVVPSFYGRDYFFGASIYNAALTATPALAARTAHIGAYSVPTSFTKRIVLCGDSAFEGYNSTRGKALLQQLVLPGWELFNTAIGGDSFNACYSNRVARRDNLYTASIPCYCLCEAGANDFFSSQTGANTYNNFATPWITTGQGIGFIMGLATNSPITAPTFTAPMQAQRVAYNALVVANGAGANFIADVASNPFMGPLLAPNDPTLYSTDGIHPTTLGYGYEATLSWQPQINSH